ncbi:hypothetical protein I580_02987 [Enterococcus caccae ATCC BAA-1240]|uniref:Uncharacterized protein n=1 Tax=Enterococcus caccae ATCC BAA-1240 TaxID=1158612 RepID=R3U9F1_9ENTE|nr:hypothetical protein UC7_00512 [Enterococcus caccae ATCC BAA-1240]EOT56187.1 hypothetical protein I580_02987 [Enterococcus caccae ATCC BAA-1240]
MGSLGISGIKRERGQDKRVQLIFEGIVSDSIIYSHLGCETKVIFTFVSHPFFYSGGVSK